MYIATSTNLLLFANLENQINSVSHGYTSAHAPKQYNQILVLYES